MTKHRPMQQVSNGPLVQFARLERGGRHAALVEHRDGPVVFDVATSNIYDISLEDADALRQFAQSGGAVELKTARLSKLISSGELFGPDEGRKKHLTTDKLLLQDIVVQIAYGCNLRCTYCYADKGLYGGKAAQMMNADVARKVVDFGIAHRASNTLGFCLLGGEPLINREVLLEFVQYARQRAEESGISVEFSVTTNGIGLTEELLSFFKENGVGVRLSIDGTKAIHDKYRLDIKGRGTFDLVNDRYGKLLRESGVSYQVRASYFGEFGDQLLEQAQTMMEQYGYTNIKLDFIWGEDGTIGEVTDDNLEKTIGGIDRLSEWYSQRVLKREIDWRSVHPFSKYIGRLLQRGPVANIFFEENRGELIAGDSILENSGVECGAGVNVISVSAQGDIHTCHRTEGKKDYRMGSITGGIDQDFIKYWTENWRLDHPKADCPKCWARYTCIGGCAAFGVYKHKDPMMNDRIRCELRRQFIANSIIIKHKMDALEIR